MITRLRGERHHLLQRPADQQRRPGQRRDQHPFVRAGLELEQQVRADGRGAEQRRHHQDRRHEPLPDAAAQRGVRLAAERADEQRPEQRRGTPAAGSCPNTSENGSRSDRPQLAGHHEPGVTRTGSGRTERVAAVGRIDVESLSRCSCCVLLGRLLGGAGSRVSASRRLRPVRVRNTSSSVGRCTCAAASMRGAPVGGRGEHSSGQRARAVGDPRLTSAPSTVTSRAPRQRLDERRQLGAAVPPAVDRQHDPVAGERPP